MEVSLSDAVKYAEKINELVAPHIVGNEDVKKAIGLQLFARPEIGEKLHILLIGSAAAGKSEILVDVTRVSDARYATSKVSVAGLTGAVVGSTFVPGIMSECDTGIVCVDEFDKIKDEERAAFLEAMQKGTTTVIKALHHKTIPTRVNVLAASNPVGGRWSAVPSVQEIPFEMPMLSRFHLVVPYKDLPGKCYDNIAKGIEYKLNNFYNAGDAERTDFVKSYVRFTKEKVPNVKVDNEIVDSLGKWVGMLKEDNNFAMPVTPRLIEGMLAMMRARARSLMKEKAGKEELDYIKKLALNIMGKWQP